MIDQDTYNLLTIPVATNAITQGSVYPDALPENCPYPAYVYSFDSDRIERSHSGPAGLDEYNMSITCFSQGKESLSTSIKGLCDFFNALTREALAGYNADETTVQVYSQIHASRGSSFYDHDSGAFIQEIYLTFYRIY